MQEHGHHIAYSSFYSEYTMGQQIQAPQQPRSHSRAFMLPRLTANSVLCRCYKRQA